MKRQYIIKAIIDSHALKGNILLKQSLIAMHKKVMQQLKATDKNIAKIR